MVAIHLIAFVIEGWNPVQLPRHKMITPTWKVPLTISLIHFQPSSIHLHRYFTEEHLLNPYHISSTVEAKTNKRESVDICFSFSIYMYAYVLLPIWNTGKEKVLYHCLAGLKQVGKSKPNQKSWSSLTYSWGGIPTPDRLLFPTVLLMKGLGRRGGEGEGECVCRGWGSAISINLLCTVSTKGP